MTARNFVALALLTVAGSATAQSYQLDGCAELARIVYDEVQSSALDGPGRGGPWVIGNGQGDLHDCPTVAKTVSRAFTLAMASAGHKVGWPSRGIAPGDVCLSGFLSQCYPDRDRMSYGYDGGSHAYWSAVTSVVMSAMYNPMSSNSIRFRSDELRLRMGLALRTVGRGD